MITYVTYVESNIPVLTGSSSGNTYMYDATTTQNIFYSSAGTTNATCIELSSYISSSQEYTYSVMFGGNFSYSESSEGFNYISATSTSVVRKDISRTFATVSPFDTTQPISFYTFITSSIWDMDSYFVTSTRSHIPSATEDGTFTTSGTQVNVTNFYLRTLTLASTSTLSSTYSFSSYFFTTDTNLFINTSYNGGGITTFYDTSTITNSTSSSSDVATLTGLLYSTITETFPYYRPNSTMPYIYYKYGTVWEVVTDRSFFSEVTAGATTVLVDGNEWAFVATNTHSSNFISVFGASITRTIFYPQTSEGITIPIPSTGNPTISDILSTYTDGTYTINMPSVVDTITLTRLTTSYYPNDGVPYYMTIPFSVGTYTITDISASLTTTEMLFSETISQTVTLSLHQYISGGRFSSYFTIVDTFITAGSLNATTTTGTGFSSSIGTHEYTYSYPTIMTSSSATTYTTIIPFWGVLTQTCLGRSVTQTIAGNWTKSDTTNIVSRQDKFNSGFQGYYPEFLAGFRPLSAIDTSDNIYSSIDYTLPTLSLSLWSSNTSVNGGNTVTYYETADIYTFSTFSISYFSSFQSDSVAGFISYPTATSRVITYALAPFGAFYITQYWSMDDTMGFTLTCQSYTVITNPFSVIGGSVTTTHAGGINFLGVSTDSTVLQTRSLANTAGGYSPISTKDIFGMMWIGDYLVTKHTLTGSSETTLSIGTLSVLYPYDIDFFRIKYSEVKNSEFSIFETCSPCEAYQSYNDTVNPNYTSTFLYIYNPP